MELLVSRLIKMIHELYDKENILPIVMIANSKVTVLNKCVIGMNVML